MKTTILACNTLRREIELAARKTACDHPVIWVESGLHLQPDMLRRRLQEELDLISGVDRVLLGFGFCGHAVVGLTSGDYELVLPKVDDCITLLLGSQEDRTHCLQDGGIYFLTQGWLEGEANICKEYQVTLDRYGRERTDRIYKKMLAHYQFLGLIDTGAYDLGALKPRIQEFADMLHLTLRILPGSDEYLKQWLTGPWDDDAFLIIPPRTTITHAHVGLGYQPAPFPMQG